MRRFGFGLVIVGLAVAAQAAQLDADYFVPKLDLLTTRFAYSGTDFLPSFQIGASVVFTRPPDVLPLGSGSGSTSQLSSIARLQQEIAQATNANRQQTNGADRISLLSIFRMGFKEEQVNVTVHSHSALIEKKQLKIILQPHSAFMVWSKAF